MARYISPDREEVMARVSALADALRQEKIWKREGIALTRATLGKWVIEAAQTWQKPLYRMIRQHLTGLDAIHADETVVQVHREEGRANTSESRMWVYASGRYSKEQIRFFEYQPDRSGKHPAALLKDFKGCLITDGYAKGGGVQRHRLHDGGDGKG